MGSDHRKMCHVACFVAMLISCVLCHAYIVCFVPCSHRVIYVMFISCVLCRFYIVCFVRS